MGYVFIGADGAEARIASLSGLVEALERGSIDESTLIRREEESRWTKLGDRPDLAAILRVLDREPGANRKLNPAEQSSAVPSRVSTDAHVSKLSAAGPVSAPTPARSPFAFDERRWNRQKHQRVEPRMKRLTVFAAIAIAIEASMVIYAGYTAWAWSEFIGLIERYGYGNVPMTEIHRLFSMNVAEFLDKGGAIAIGIVSVGFFFAAMYEARECLIELGARFKFSFSWTVGSLIIPFLCLIRPWLGLAEIRRAAIVSGRRGIVDESWRSAGFSWSTLLLTLIWFGSILAGNTVEKDLDLNDRMFETGPIIAAEGILADLMAATLIGLLVAVVTAWYLLSIRASLRRLAASYLKAGEPKLGGLPSDARKIA